MNLYHILLFLVSNHESFVFRFLLLFLVFSPVLPQRMYMGTIREVLMDMGRRLLLLNLMKNIMDMEVFMAMDMAIDLVDMGDCMVDMKDTDMRREMAEDLEWVDMVGE